MIVHINGWPGSGKLTVGREVARKLGARLLDNHTLHDVAIRLCERGTPEYWDLYYQVREEKVRRLQSERRRHRKMIDPKPLVEWRSKYELLTDDTVPSLTVDNTSLTPDAAADEIVTFVGGIPP